MKKVPFLLMLPLVAGSSMLYAQESSFYDLSFTALNGEKVAFSDFKGKYVLIVNTASKCGFTPQYEDLEKLSQLYAGKLVVIGFPANNFGRQEPGTNDEIATFCRANYGVTFRMMEKSSVRGKDKNIVYQWLTDKSKNGWNSDGPSWNFCKYLINKEGKLIKFYKSAVKPLDEAITGEII